MLLLFYFYFVNDSTAARMRNQLTLQADICCNIMIKFD